MKERTNGPANQTGPVKDPLQAELLYEQLDDFMEHATVETFDEAELNRIMAALDEVDPLPDLEQLDVQASLAKFKREHAEFFSDQEEEHSSVTAVPPNKGSKKRALRVIIPAAAAVCVLLGGIIGTQAGGFRLFNYSFETSGETYQPKSPEQNDYVGVVVLSEGQEMEFDNLQQALDRLAIIDQLAPTELPDGYQQKQILATLNNGELRIRAEYLKDSELLTINIYQIKNLIYPSSEKIFGEVQTYESGNVEHDIMVNYDRIKTIWHTGEWECTISGSISQQEMEAVIDSIYR